MEKDKFGTKTTYTQKLVKTAFFIIKNQDLLKVQNEENAKIFLTKVHGIIHDEE